MKKNLYLVFASILAISVVQGQIKNENPGQQTSAKAILAKSSGETVFSKGVREKQLFRTPELLTTEPTKTIPLPASLEKLAPVSCKKANNTPVQDVATLGLLFLYQFKHSREFVLFNLAL